MNNPVESLATFYRGKRVFLTGHTGFKGSWMALLLHTLGARVYGYALPPENIRGCLYELLDVARLVETSTFGNVCNYDAFRDALIAAKPDIILHMAAQPLVKASYADPRTTYLSNVMGSVNLFEIVRSGGLRASIVNVTTDKCYENRDWVWPYRENDALGGHDPYSASKACAEIITRSYRDSFFRKSGVLLASARAGNVIGGGDFSADRIIPDIVAAVSKDATVTLRSPSAIRPWQHVLEVITGYLMLAQRLHTQGDAFAQAYNFGPDDFHPITVEALTKIFIDTLGRGDYTIQPDPNLHETHLLRLDNSKVKKELGWKPRYSQEEAIHLTADWFAAYLAQKDMRAATQQQAVDYLGLLAA
ncbi:MAG: CDP-glucose 4,6-dehydratase [Alphaproteobacteria bacterium]|nr:CDP-glucose 4,6-dehydratase [Alphaproteobacteria bacterium]